MRKEKGREGKTETVRTNTHYAVGHNCSLYKASQHISGVVLVVRYTGQTCVEGHHQQSELEERPQEASSTPREPRLQVELEREKDSK